jgi:hypothetical protein
VIGVLIAIAGLAGLQGAQQQPPSRPGWPCVGRPDPSYVQVAEGSGGQVFLLQPSELGASAAVLMTAPGEHPATLRRVVGEIEGAADYEVAVDQSVDRLMVSASVQCLQTLEVTRPSGVAVSASDAGIGWHQFQAGRLIVIPTPEPGVWRLALAGSGLAFVVVQARASLAIEDVALVRETGRPGEEELGRDDRPLVAGTRRLMRIRLSAGIVSPQFEMRAANDTELGRFPPARLPASDGQTYVIGFDVPGVPFRMVVTGRDKSGKIVQRAYGPLFQLVHSR